MGYHWVTSSSAGPTALRLLPALSRREAPRMSPAATVSAELEMRLVVPGGPPLPVPARLTYAADDPWAVRVAFQTGAGPDGDGVVEWLFARQLLSEGTAAAVGDGDVRVWPTASRSAVALAMASPSGSALFEVDRDPLVEFLQASYLAVPTGSEQDAVDLDGELEVLVGRR